MLVFTLIAFLINEQKDKESERANQEGIGSQDAINKQRYWTVASAIIVVILNVIMEAVMTAVSPFEKPYSSTELQKTLAVKLTIG